MFRPLLGVALELLAEQAPDPHLAPPSAPLSVDRLEWEHIQRVLKNLIGNPLETTIALHYLIFDGVLERHPNLKIFTGSVLPAAMAKMERDLGDCDAVQEMLTFLRGCTNCHGAIHGSYTDDTLQH